MAKSFKKMICLILASWASSSVYASYPTVDEPFTEPQYHTGFYIGGQWGRGAQRLDNGDEQDALTGNILQLQASKTHGMVGRLDLGFDANEYFGIELGGARWPQGHYNESAVDLLGTTLGTGRAKVNTYDLDLLAKVTLPFNNGLGIFTKFGGAEVVSNTNLTGALSSFTPLVYRQANGRDYSLRPEVAAGVSYEFNLNWQMALDYSYILGRKSNSLNTNYQPDLHSWTLGVQYNFVTW